MSEGIKNHNDICPLCQVRREVTVWRRDGASRALLPAKCPHMHECADFLVRAAGFDPVQQMELEN